MIEEHLFVEKYRPKTLNECVLPQHLKERFAGMVAKGQLQNMIFSGRAGVGKTTVAIALCNDVESPFLFVNASKDSGIDHLRHQLTSFAESLSIVNQNRKTIILDEGDGLSRRAQEGLKSFVEKYSSHVGFIITCNNKSNIIEPLQSRMVNIEFNFANDIVSMMAEYMKRMRYILDSENIEYDPKVLAELIPTFFPDFRKILDEIQAYSVNGKLDSGIFTNIQKADVHSVYEYMAKKQWGKLRDYIESIANVINVDSFIMDLYDNVDTYVVEKYRPNAIIIIHDHDKVLSSSVNKIITLVSLCTQLMITCKFDNE